VVAVGGYGRGELSPHSDIDLLFLWPGRSKDAEVSRATLRNLLYPLWDAGFQVGHAAADPKDAVDRCGNDIHAATAALSARFVTGAHGPFEEFMDRRARWLHKGRKGLVRRIVESTAERHRHADKAGWMLAPDLKDDIGGLRDVNAIQWLAVVLGTDAPPDLLDPFELLMSVREALHSEVTRKLDRIHIELQPRVAGRLGIEHEDAADELMARVHAAARRIEHVTAMSFERFVDQAVGGPRRSGSSHDLGDGIRIEDGLLGVKAGSPPQLSTALRLLAARSSTGRAIAAPDIAWLEQAFRVPPCERWDEDMLRAFLELLKGPDAEAALQLAEHVGAWPVLLPEWDNVRGRAQHDPYHRYTVDGHSFVTVASIQACLATDGLARSASEEAGDLSALYIGALLHDIGKGSGEDHSVAGERIARKAAARMGLPHRDVEDVAALVRHHLLLSDTATRRDLDDGGVIGGLVATIGDPRVLRMLYVLSAADGRATGRESWSPWKASLVAETYRKALVALETGELPRRSDVAQRLRELEAYDPVAAGSAERVLATLPPSYLASTHVEDMAEDLRLLLDPPYPGEVSAHIEVRAGEAALTICVPDTPGALARTAGVLALHRMSVLRAQAYSTDTGLALERFVVQAPDNADWSRLKDDIAASFAGRVALEAQLEQKALDYRPRVPVRAEVRVLQDESEHSTVLEVRAPDALGLLYAITSALGELGLDIHVAKIDTLGERVVDVFYVRSPAGTKLDAAQAQAAERAIEHRVRRLFP
ncbi:MAG: [protein-PII] uridylyltransferase, partial [Actinomycetota bacterium]